MSEEKKGKSKSRGIRLAPLNTAMICVTAVLALLIGVSIYLSSRSVNSVVTVTRSYMRLQSSAGMLRDFAGSMSDQALLFVQRGEIGSAHAYAGQMGALQSQVDEPNQYGDTLPAAAAEYRRALESFREGSRTEIAAMRLVAENLPKGAFESLPEYLKNAEISDEDRALTPEARKEKALALLNSEAYLQTRETAQTAIQSSQRLAGENGQAQADKTSAEMSRSVRIQAVLLILSVLLSVLALTLNRILVINPLRKSVNHLNRREPIPEWGSEEMRHMARVYNDVLRDNQEKTLKLTYAATHDTLTGVYSRTDFDRYYRQIEKAENVGLVMLDVDHFKQFNDDYGHDIGDRVLCAAVSALKRHFRKRDHISRVGGDEFCIILSDVGHADGPMIREKIEAVNQELALGEKQLPPITVSAGVAFWDRPGPQGSLFKDADTALLEVKKSRRGCCAVWGEETPA